MNNIKSNIPVFLFIGLFLFSLILPSTIVFTLFEESETVHYFNMSDEEKNETSDEVKVFDEYNFEKTSFSLFNTEPYTNNTHFYLFTLENRTIDIILPPPEKRLLTLFIS